MFLGTHTPRLDDKGRLFLPAKFRDRLADGLVITRGQERCLYVFPMDEFVRVTEQMQSAPTTSKAVRELKRGDIVSFRLNGAGGYGPPEERSPAAIQDDLADGYITPQFATAAYKHPK